MAKKYIPIVLLLVYFSSCTNQTEKVAKRWNMTELKVGEQKLSGKEVKGFVFNLKSDGNYKMTAMEEETGTWRLDGDTLYTKRAGSETIAKILIEILTEEKMVLTANSQGVTVIMTFVPEK